MVNNLLVIFAVFIFLYFFLSFIQSVLPFGRPKILRLKKRGLAKKIELDLKSTKRHIFQFEKMMKRLDSIKKSLAIKKVENLKTKEKKKILEFWADFLDFQIALGKMTDDYQYFYQISYFFNRKSHVKAFLIGYASFLCSYKNGMRLIDQVAENKTIENFLNDKNKNFGIQEGLYSRLKSQLISTDTVLRLFAGYGNLKFLDSDFKKFGIKDKEKKIFLYIKKTFHKSAQGMKENSIDWFSKDTKRILKKKAYEIWFPIQRNVVSGIGKIYLSKRQKKFIKRRQIIKMRRKLKPGDIVLQRKNWYLTNAGIPGFWTHAAIYIGKLRKAEKFFNNKEVKDFLKKNDLGSFRNAIKRKNRNFWKSYQLGIKETIEAREPGVIIQTLEKSARVDYVGVLRPKLDKLSIFKALMFSFAQYGKPYDFHFDFSIDSSFVCSELVYKAYQEFLSLDLESHAGKKMFTPTQFVKKFDEEHDNKNRELDFVYFLEGNEKKKRAFVKSEEDFRKTWKRPKWDILQD